MKKRTGCLLAGGIIFMLMMLFMVGAVISLHVWIERLEEKKSLTKTELKELAKLIRAYKNEHGTYPKSIKDLGTTIPVDPFNTDGKTYKYLNLNNGAIVRVYSIGPDGVDDMSLENIDPMNPKDIYVHIAPEPDEETIKLHFYENLLIELTQDDPDNGMADCMKAIVALDFPEDKYTSEISLILKKGWDETQRLLKDKESEENRKEILSVLYKPSYMMDETEDDIINGLESDLQGIVTLFEKNQKSFNLIRKGVNAKYIRAEFPEEMYGHSDASFEGMKYFNMNILLEVEGKYFEYQGTPEKAVANYLDVIRYNQSMGNGISQIGKIMAIGIEMRGHNLLHHCITDNSLSADLLKTIIERSIFLEKESANLMDYFLCEKKYLIADIREMPNGFTTNIYDLPDELLFLVNRNKIIRDYNKIWDDVFEAIEKPYEEAITFDRDKAVEDKHDFIRIGMPDVMLMLTNNLKKVTLARGTIILAGLELYHLKHDKYPDSIQKLLPDILKELPLDLFTKKEFSYSKNEDGFLLFSYGPDCDNDKGLVDYNNLDGTRSNGDIVFP